MRVGAPLLRGAFVDQIDPTLNPVESPTDVVQPLARRARCGNLAPPLRNRWFADSPLEGDGFELPVRRRGQCGCRPFWVGCALRSGAVRARRFWYSAVSATGLGDLSRRARGLSSRR